MRVPFIKKGKKKGEKSAYEETQASEEIGEETSSGTEKDSLKETGPGLFGRLKRSLSETRQTLVIRVGRIVKGKGEIDEELLEELEEVLIGADLGVPSTMQIISQLREQADQGKLQYAEEIHDGLRFSLEEILKKAENKMNIEAHDPSVIMVIGVNGVGKTTTIGKLAWKFQKQGKKVTLAAADTFRAAAGEQLEVWAQRVHAHVIRHQSGADPAAVVFDALQAAKAKGSQVVIVDTAGRLHTKTNLMEELKKMKRVISRDIPSAPHEILLVIDANTGQNGISQARLFHQALGVTGLVLTKLDGTAKGGVVINIVKEFGLPIHYIGIGEQLDDLREFDSQQFVAAIFEE